MSGETDLNALLRGLSPVLDPTNYVFVSVSNAEAAKYSDQAIMRFNEDEGVTVLLPVDESFPEKFTGKDRFSKITLKIHSSLHAVGLTAAVSDVLARQQIPANMVAGFYHDHLFVPVAKATTAIEALQSIAQSSD
ncbi:MAG: ACT domain-containing protein [Woeseiaceae bacterium]